VFHLNLIREATCSVSSESQSEKKKAILPAILEFFRRRYRYKNAQLVQNFNSRGLGITLTEPRLCRWIKGNSSDLLTKEEYINAIIEFIFSVLLDQDAPKLSRVLHDKFPDSRFERQYRSREYREYLEARILDENSTYNALFKGFPAPSVDENPRAGVRTLAMTFGGLLIACVVALTFVIASKTLPEYAKPRAAGGASALINASQDTRVLVVEAESFSGSKGAMRLEEKPTASAGKCVHVGPDSADGSAGVGDRVNYRLSLTRNMQDGVLSIRYADDKGGNLFDVLWDGARKGMIRTGTTGGWDIFQHATQLIRLGPISAGTHSLELRLTRGGSYGALLDSYELADGGSGSDVGMAYGFLLSLVNANTGLVQSTVAEKRFTTLKKVSLAAIAFIHEGDFDHARRIFDFFSARYGKEKKAFTGFNKNWDPDTGNEGEPDHYMGDNALLLIALLQYRASTGSFGPYGELADGLVRLIADGDLTQTIPVGLAVIHAALSPFAGKTANIDAALVKIEKAFDSSKDANVVLDHIAFDSLCFGRTGGLRSAESFTRKETWTYDGVERVLMTLYRQDTFVNVEASVQTLLAWKTAQSVGMGLSSLERDLDSLWLLSGKAGGTLTHGLPFFLSDAAQGWPDAWDEPIVDTTCWMLFAKWNFNPFRLAAMPPG
jgi:hypothetical protein